MAVCTNCGKEFDRIGTNCPYCHAKLGLTNVTTKNKILKYHGRYDDKSKSLMVLSIIFPPLGFISYFKNKDEYTLRASSGITGAIGGTIIYLIIITILIYFLLF